MNVSYEGIGEKVVTMKAADGLAAGMLAKISESDTAAACGSGELFHGRALSVREGYAVVQIDGFVTVPYTGTAPTAGYCALLSDAAGASVHTDAEDGRTCLVVSVDETAGKVTFCL